jgi:hypothetical protein
MLLVGLSDAEADLIRSLLEEEVRFMVVGMSAAILQNAPGMTQDIDLWFEGGQGDRLTEACRKIGATYYWRTSPPKIYGPGIDQVDVVWNCHGLKSFADEYENAVSAEVAPGLTVKVLPLERIIVSKRAAGRLKDKAALPMLRDALKTLKKVGR